MFDITRDFLAKTGCFLTKKAAARSKMCFVGEKRAGLAALAVVATLVPISAVPVLLPGLPASPYSAY